MDDQDPFSDSIKIEIDGVLDLHHFSPKDLKTLIPVYIVECINLNIFEVRIIHGKGKGVLRRTVHSLLENHPLVLEFKLDTGPSSWGSTVLRLKARGGRP